MRFSIEHSMRFEYSRPVFLEPMLVRVAPQTNAAQHCESCYLHVDPQPAGVTRLTDVSGQLAHQLWFAGTQSTLTLRAESVVETLRVNPYDFILTDPMAMKLPVAYAPAFMKPLGPYLEIARRGAEAPGECVEELVAAISNSAHGQTMDFLIQLCHWLFAEIKYEIRPDGASWPAEQTLTERRGSCRDMAVVMMAACRRVGIAARFVSGYQWGDPAASDENAPMDEADIAANENTLLTQGDPDLHAWVEVFIPGGGWRGFDPTTGFAVADRHIAVATGASPELAAPTRGAFRGTRVKSKLIPKIVIQPIGER